MPNALKKLLSVTAIAGAALMATTSAHAVLNVPSGGSAFQPFGALVGKNSLSDSFGFTLGGLSDLSGFAVPSFISGFSATLSGGSLGTIPLTDSSPLPGIQFSYAGLAPGSYTLNFTGEGFKKFSGYGGVFHIAAAVPEPSTIALALAAAGLLGGLAWRKRSRS
jgi:hypothetical protein